MDNWSDKELSKLIQELLENGVIEEEVYETAMKAIQSHDYRTAVSILRNAGALPE
jgi:Cdc6-like AAA superfamily ATPase